MNRSPQASREVERHLPSACVLVLVLACGIELACAPLQLTPHFVACVLALALVLGGLYGNLLRAVFFGISHLPKMLPYLAWPLVTLVLAGGLGWALGAQKHLHDGYDQLAWLVITVVSGGSVAFSLVLCGMQAPRPHAVAFLAARAPRTRALVSLALIAGALALGVADRWLYRDLYGVAHGALRAAAVALGTCGFALSHERSRLPAWSHAASLVALVAAGFLLLTLNERQPRSVQALLARAWPRSLLSFARLLTDVDADGYAAILAGGDCAAFDPRVHPGAREIPDNGIDDNCVLGDAHARKAASAPPAGVTGRVPIDVVLITVDSLRRDRVGTYAKQLGKVERELTPALDAFAAHATVFEHAYTPGGWTSVAIPALLRGVYPRRLRWTRFYETSTHRLLRAPLARQLTEGEQLKWLFAFPSDDPHVPLAQLLAARGMSAIAVVDDGRSEILRPGTGFDLGFERYVEVNPGPIARRDDMNTSGLAIAALERPRGRQRVFLWVHYFGVHSPNEWHPGVPRYGDGVEDRYDHEIRYFDRALEQLLAAIERRGRPTAVFISADHGEEFDARVRYHGYSLSEAMIAVPLIARVPGWPTGQAMPLVNLVDLVPTILALTDTPRPAGLDGEDLAVLLSAPKPSARVLLSDTWRFDVNQHLVADFGAAYDTHETLIVDELGYGALRYDKRHPAAEPSLSFDPERDRLSRALYGYLEETGGVPLPRD